MSDTMTHTNGTAPTKLDALERDVATAEQAVRAATKADRKAGDNQAEKAKAFVEARDAKAATAATLAAARTTLAKAEQKLSDEQGRV